MSDLSLDGLETMQGITSANLQPMDINDRPLTPIEEATQAVADRVFTQAEFRKVVAFDAGKEIVEAGQAFENKCTKQIGDLESESNRCIELIDMLLDLSKEAGGLNAEKPKMTEKMQDLIDKLKEKGLDVINLDKSKGLDKDMLASLKAAVGSHVDKLRTQIQQLFTKMQTVIQNMSSVFDVVKKMIAEQSDLIRKILDRAIKH